MNQTTQLILFTVMIMVVSFLPTYLSNKKRRKEKQNMMDNLKVGDKVVTIGGIKGEVAVILTDSVELKRDKNARITIIKSAISSVSK